MVEGGDIIVVEIFLLFPVTGVKSLASSRTWATSSEMTGCSEWKAAMVLLV